MHFVPLRFGSSLFLFAAAAGLLSAQSPLALRSPNSNLRIQLETTADNRPAEAGQLAYSVTVSGKPLIDRSALRLELQGHNPLGTAVRITKQTLSTADKTYKLVAGKRSVVRDHYNSLSVETEDSEGRKLTAEARAYDDAIAFRYVVPDQTGLREFRLMKETTEFRLNKDATTYALVLPNFRSSYESEYIKLNASAFAGRAGLSGTNLIVLPLLMEVPGVMGRHRCGGCADAAASGMGRGSGITRSLWHFWIAAHADRHAGYSGFDLWRRRF